MPRKTLVIRTIDGIQLDDLKTALKGLDPSQLAPEKFNELIRIIRSDNLSVSDLNLALDLIKDVSVRDYIYETVKELTGNHIIYHLNGIDDNGRTHDHNVSYVTTKLENIAPNSAFNVLYLGGGHGHPVNGSSNLSSKQLQLITKTLNDRHVKFSGVILGSCFSAAYAGLYQPLLQDNGVMLSNSLECGGDNNYRQVMEWINEPQKLFYSEEDVLSSIKVSREVRSAIRRVLEGTVPQGEKLTVQYNELLDFYKQRAREHFLSAKENEIYELSGDLFNEDLNQVIIKMQGEREPLNVEKIQSILREYPLLDAHVKRIAQIRGENVIFDALVNSLQPTPTSLVIGTSNTLTLFNFDNAKVEMPPNAEGDFRRNYRLVLRQVQTSNKFKEINEVSHNFNAVSAKRYFNELFDKAIFKADLVEHIAPPVASEQREVTNQNDVLEQLSMNIDARLNEFEQLITRIGGHYSNAQETAQELLRTLRHHKTVAFVDYRDVIYKSLGTFKKTVTFTINHAAPELQRDLGWGDYLANLVKQIVNAITIAAASIVTFGTSSHQGFFAIKRSEVLQSAEDLIPKFFIPMT